MAKPYDTRLIMMVSQLPFETQDMNQFCKLIPIVYIDGVRASETDFPNDGEIWWMLNARTASLAVPGKLVVGIVEDAIRYEEADPTSSSFQVQRDSIRELDLNDGIEVLAIPNKAVDNMQDLVSSGFRLDLPSPATSQVMLRWRGNVYGPFRTTRDSTSAGTTSMATSFKPSNVDLTVDQLSEKTFDEATKGHRIRIDEQVSPTSNRRSEGYSLAACNHDLLLPTGYERIFLQHVEKIVLEPMEQKLLRFAKKCLTWSKYKHFRALLQELEVTGRETTEFAELVDVVKRIKEVTENQDLALNAISKALLESGMLGEDRIRKAEQTFADKYVQERSAQLQAKAQESIGVVNAELRKAQSDLKDVQARLQKEETERRTKLDQSLESEKENARKAIQAEQSALNREKTELDHQRQVLQKNLEQVTKELREAGDTVLNRFLTIAPLLGLMGISSVQRIAANEPAIAGEPQATPTAVFQIPVYVGTSSTTNSQPLSEEAFFGRFRTLVGESGFVYRPIDLQRFHLSVKCGEMTVLGGPSGTGKSSLPTLYTRALHGDDAATGRPGCLMVNINPSWMDIRDLLGHMNTLEGKYYPAESGLFQHLVYAQVEYAAKSRSTGLYLACLDEMNLSQVEHYFSDFMMVLDREESARFIQCFSPEVVRASCAFRAYSRLRLSPGAKFIGTVNFDETTRLLSDRFLDRVNLIRLSSDSLPSVSTSSSEGLAKASGQMVTLADFESWRADAALPAELGALIDSMRPLLNQIGCPLSPRVYRGICRFVASSTKIMSTDAAFDVQMAQRVVPKVRGLVTKRQLESLDSLLKLMNTASACAFKECLPLLEVVHDSVGTRVWDIEE